MSSQLVTVMMVISEETRKRMSIAQKKRHQLNPHPRLGKKLSQEHKEALKRANLQQSKLKEGRIVYVSHTNGARLNVRVNH
jgi:hypothetical protein